MALGQLGSLGTGFGTLGVLGAGNPIDPVLAAYLASNGWTGSVAGADFETGTFWLPNIAVGSIAAASAAQLWPVAVTEAVWAAQFTSTATTLRPYLDINGVMQNNVASGALRYTYENAHKLLALEPGIINSVTCQKLNPTGTTNLTKAGDAASTLTVVSDTTALATAGLNVLCSNNNVYKLDNSAGVAAATVTAGGTAADTNPHSLDVYARFSAGTGTLQMSAAEGAVAMAGAAYKRYKSENATPASSASQWQISVPAGAVCFFILPGFYETRAVPLYPIADNGTATTTKAQEAFRFPTKVEALFNRTELMVKVNGRHTGIYESGQAPRIIGHNNGRYYIASSPLGQTLAMNDGTFSGALGAYGTNVSGYNAVFGFSGATRFLTQNGGALSPVAKTNETISAFYLHRDSVANHGSGTVRNVVIFPTRDDTRAATLATWKPIIPVIDCWGDSLTYGAGVPSFDGAFPYLLGRLYSPFVNYNNAGVIAYSSTNIKDKMLAAEAHSSHYTVIWAGRNNFQSFQTVMDDIAAMVANVPNGKYIILSIINGEAASEYSGGLNYTQITTINNALASLYGANYYDIRGYLATGIAGNTTTQGLTDAGITPTAQDLTDIGHDIVPASLRKTLDPVHLNLAGNTVTAARVKAIADGLAYVPAQLH